MVFMLSFASVYNRSWPYQATGIIRENLNPCYNQFAFYGPET